jgi:hypothetical protein
MLMSCLPEWVVYVETTGCSYFSKPIVGMIATLFDAPTSLVMTLIPEYFHSTEDLRI